MGLDIYTLIGEATAYDKKQMLEIKRPKSWLKSASAFANSERGILSNHYTLNFVNGRFWHGSNS